MNRRKYSRFVIALVAIALSGCASFSSDGGFDAVRSATRERIDKDVRWARSGADADAIRASIRELIVAPLDADRAVQIALLNNRGLQANYAQLGIAEADLVQAGRLRNPLFSFGRFRRGDELEIERALAFDLLGLLTMPARSEFAAGRFEQAKLQTASSVLQVAMQTRRAFFAAVAAAETVKYLEQARDAAEASAELARRMAAAGNFSRLDHAREHAFYAEVTARLARATQAAIVEREKLVRLLGLWGEELNFRLPERLPALPRSIKPLAEVEQTAIKSRLDVQSAVRESELLARSLGLARVTGMIDTLELGYERNSETGHPVQRGFELELRLPIFDWGQASVRRAEHQYMQAVHRVADTAVRARSEARAAYASYRSAFDVAKHYRDELVPLRKRISEELLLRYNGMLISVFEVLADAREQVNAVNGYIESLRDFWLADTDLQNALVGSSSEIASMASEPASAMTPRNAGH